MFSLLPGIVGYSRQSDFYLGGGGGCGGGGGGHAYSLISEIFPIYGIGNELVKPYQLSRGL